jgi:hypothetical protein
MAFPDCLGLGDDPHPDTLNLEDIQEIAKHLDTPTLEIAFIKGFVQSVESVQGDLVDTLRGNILMDYVTTVFSGKTTGIPLKRGLYGEV